MAEEFEDIYYYVAATVGAAYVHTVFLCVPDEFARTKQDAQDFASCHGWIEQAERDSSILIVPLAPEGWAKQPTSHLMSLFKKYATAFFAPSGVAIPGRGLPGQLWLWEPMVYVAGYGEGATYAADVLVAEPGFAAATVLVGGRASSLEAADRETSCWVVPQHSDAYHKINREVPVAAWLVGEDDDGGALRGYLAQVDQATAHSTVTYQGREIEVAENPTEPAWHIWSTPDLALDDPAIARIAVQEFFSRVYRWKGGPDGTLKVHTSKAEFLGGAFYKHGTIHEGGLDYPYAVHLPAGLGRGDVRGLPLVLSIHGRGEGIWSYAEKNGWEALADETRAFVTVSPDSLYEIWVGKRDMHALELLVKQVLADFELDPERVYVTGFSNGGMMTYQASTTMPQLFAAASPWNSPAGNAGLPGFAEYFVNPDFASLGCEMPLWAFYGDRDTKIPYDEGAFLSDGFFACNGTSREQRLELDPVVAFPEARGYRESERMPSWAWRNAQGSTRIGLTLVRDVPHGSIWDEARAAWEFMSRFRRPAGSKRVVEL